MKRKYYRKEYTGDNYNFSYRRQNFLSFFNILINLIDTITKYQQIEKFAINSNHNYNSEEKFFVF